MVCEAVKRNVEDEELDQESVMEKIFVREYSRDIKARLFVIPKLRGRMTYDENYCDDSLLINND